MVFPMPGKTRIGYAVNKKGRSKSVERYVCLRHWEIQSPAYRSLSVGARALLIELKALYNGFNNGTLFLSVREAAKRLGVGKTFAAKCFRELQDRGFIRVSKAGAFSLKMSSRRGDATAWALTEYPVGNEMGVGTKDFMRWAPPPNFEAPRRKIYLTVRDRDELSRQADTPSVPADICSEMTSKCPAMRTLCAPKH